MAMRGYVLVHSNCEIMQNTEDGVRFCCPNPIHVSIRSSMSISELHEKILHKLHQPNNHIVQMLYRLPLLVGQGTLRFTSCLIETDDDIEMMFDCHSRFPDLSVMEIFVAVGGMNLSSGGSAPDPAFVDGALVQRSPTLAMPNLVQNENFVQENENDIVGRQSFDLNVGIVVPQIGPNPSYDDISNEEDSEEDPNEELFENEMDEEIVPPTQGQFSTTQTQTQSESQRVGHYSSLTIEAMQLNQLDDSDPLGLVGVNQLCEGQQFPNKDDVLLAVKNYSIRKGAEYKVCQSDHVKYQGQCKHFGRGCNWSIRVIYRRKKGLWEIKKYNGEHTCLTLNRFRHVSRMQRTVAKARSQPRDPPTARPSRPIVLRKRWQVNRFLCVGKRHEIG